YVNKEHFFLAFKNTFLDIFMYNNCKKAFKASRLVSINTQVVLNYLNMQLCTLLLEPLL
ncbi:uncharacterized protein BDR25DRAFT_169286, partial [Lindgomyces ingoldianus]